MSDLTLDPSSTPTMRDCEVCGRLKLCELVHDRLLKRSFWMCATCPIGLSRGAPKS